MVSFDKNSTKNEKIEEKLRTVKSHINELSQPTYHPTTELLVEYPNNAMP